MNAAAPLRSIALLIFDLDGTLVDSLDDLATAVNLTRADYGLAPLPREAVVRNIGNGSDVLVRDTIPRARENFAEVYGIYLAHYNAHLLDRTRLHDGVARVLEHFSDRPLAVVTNKLVAETRRILAGLGILQRFGVVLGGDSLAQKKPHPLQIEHVLAHSGCTPTHCVMIGDGINDVRAGKAAGVHTIGFTGGVDGRAALERERPGHLIERMDELLTLIA
ncbi:MAG: HAD-IA family hydrolase [Candidatus Lambdaproteobacteria bacterium]|nr:HAD-IA family hydrolase [Candidatus Lambdaproteobacteria bacterium]